MEFKLDQAIEILERSPNVIREMLQGLSPDWLHNNEGGESFSPFVVLGHLVYGELTDWIPRARIILNQGEKRTFDPYDRFAQLTLYKDTPLEELLDKFASLRKKNLDELKSINISDEKLELKGKHPDIGTVTLKQLLATWVVHDLNHIAQIARVMARQYSDEVGPWKKHNPILLNRLPNP